MACEICGETGFHSPRCPMYPPQKTRFCCSACGEGILDGEEYIENQDGEYRHYDCIYGMRELLRWLGLDVKVMEDYSYYDESTMDYSKDT